MVATLGATLYEPKIQEIPNGIVSNEAVVVGALFTVVLLLRGIAGRVEAVGSEREKHHLSELAKRDTDAIARLTQREAAFELRAATREAAQHKLSEELLAVLRGLTSEPSVPLRTMRTLSAGAAAASQVALMAGEEVQGATPSLSDVVARTRVVLDAVERVVEAVLARPEHQISVNLMTLLRNAESGSVEDRLFRAFGRAFSNPYLPSVDGVGQAPVIPWVAVLVATSTCDAQKEASIFLRIPETGGLPGAPTAVAKLLVAEHAQAHLTYKRLAFDDLPNTQEISATVEPNNVRRKALMAYFVSSELPATSFVSIALHVPALEGVLPVGVLNVNCSEPDVFRDATKQHLLLDALRPVLPHLSRLASRYTSHLA